MMLAAVWDIMLELSPWLLLGALVAAALHVFVPPNFIQKELRGPSGIVKAVLLGIPLPLCSCGVIPTGLGLQRDGASKGSTVGFLISTPQTGVDSILVSASFLGWPFALFKVGSAALTGLVGGFLTDAVEPAQPAPCSSTPTAAAHARPTIRDGLEHGLEILQTIWGWLVFGILASAAIQLFLPKTWSAELAEISPSMAIVAALLISLPVYVCATASVPIAAALVASGFPAGAALVFLMAGPATNVATLGAVYRSLGNRALAVYLSTIVIGSVGLGILFESLLLSSESVMHAHEHGTAWWATTSAVLLTALLLKFLIDDLRSLATKPAHQGSAAIKLGVDGMTCGGCVSKLQKKLLATEGVETANVSLEPGQAIVEGSLDELALKQAIEEAGFSVRDAVA